MKSLIEILEGLLDADFDITDNDVMPGVKNWPRFIGRLQSIPKPKLVQGEKRNRHIWQGTEVLEALSQGAKNDIGPTITKSEANRIVLLDKSKILIATFWPRGEKFAPVIRIGSDNEYLELRSERLGIESNSPVITSIERWAYFSHRISGMPAGNWKIRVAPAHAYDIIKRELGMS